MNETDLYKLKFPIGEFKKPDSIQNDLIHKWIDDIEKFPITIERLTKNLSLQQLQWSYRPEGWTIKQVVHHCADSHMNSIIRFKLALTEDTPTIRPYFESRWANLIDGTDDNLSATQSLLNGLHAKLGKLLRHIPKEDLSRTFVHPEHGKQFTLDETIGIYAWHCNHHLAHIKLALEHKGKFN
ncbi:YfiT family bacillithiol transferase [uncultured Psychroserpens sp.]|uniref:YfiT family bacillithiol transferase n=1 Tax=uncultured Psychroserpens sp. TaxID=255436 RepID=UPI002629B63A|nr:putative metal-dependent hydrolase [uncultured Psychroserpens sp.]